MTSNRDLFQAVHDRLEECYEMAEKHYDRDFVRLPVKFNSRLTKTAGRCNYHRANRLEEFEPTLLEFSTDILLMNPIVFVDETPGHELAHAIDCWINGFPRGSSHGYNWGQVMRVLGQSAKRLHRMETSNVGKVETYCECDTPHWLTKRKAAQIYNYNCKTCKAMLQLGKKPVLARANPIVAPKEDIIKPQDILSKIYSDILSETLITPEEDAKRKRLREAGLAALEDAKAPVPKAAPTPGGKKVSAAEQVRQVIRDNPTQNAAWLISYVIREGIVIKSRATRYVTENITRVRG